MKKNHYFKVFRSIVLVSFTLTLLIGVSIFTKLNCCDVDEHISWTEGNFCEDGRCFILKDSAIFYSCLTIMDGKTHVTNYRETIPEYSIEYPSTKTEYFLCTTCEKFGCEKDLF